MKVKRVSASVVRFWCEGCRSYHAFGRAAARFDGNYARPTFGRPLLVTDGRGNIICESTIQDGIITYTMRSRHRLAGQRMELPEGRLP